MCALLSDLADLALGRCCQCCGAPAPGLCAGCLARLRGSTRPVTVGGRAGHAACGYDGPVRELLLSYKEHGYRSLAGPLGWLLADAIWATLADSRRRSCTLVPIPAHRGSRRGFDALAAILASARTALRGAGITVGTDRLLRSRASYSSLKSLGRSDRAASVRGAFRASSRAPADPFVIVVDDIITTGATLAEAISTLEDRGFPASAISAIAVTASPGTSARFPGSAPARPRS